MITNHQIAHRNVVSKYYNFLPEEIDAAFQDFVTILEKGGYHVAGNMFFSMISDPTDEIMTAEIFLTIEEDDFTIQSDEEMFFRSYFLIKPMVMTRVMEDFDAQSQVKYWELLKEANRHGFKPLTPVFVEFKNSFLGKDYVEMSVGV